MKKDLIYQSPDIIVISLGEADVLTASAGDTELFDIW